MSDISNGTFWRENDKRFERVIEVVGADFSPDKIQVRMVWYEGRPVNTDRRSLVSRPRLPKAYKPVSDPRQ